MPKLLARDPRTLAPTGATGEQGQSQNRGDWMSYSYSHVSILQIFCHSWIVSICVSCLFRHSWLLEKWFFLFRHALKTTLESFDIVTRSKRSLFWGSKQANQNQRQTRDRFRKLDPSRRFESRFRKNTRREGKALVTRSDALVPSSEPCYY